LKHKKVLIVLDGHSTHAKNLEAIELARENGVLLLSIPVLLSIPGHTTHRLQPLDISFFKPLSAYFNQACGKWIRALQGGTISQFEVSQLLGEAYGRAESFGAAMNGFERSGIWPLNSEFFRESDFVPSTLKYRIANDDGNTEKNS
jgi:hypothetical protein